MLTAVRWFDLITAAKPHIAQAFSLVFGEKKLTCLGGIRATHLWLNVGDQNNEIFTRTAPTCTINTLAAIASKWE